jgi:hypothetical protein
MCCICWHSCEAAVLGRVGKSCNVNASTDGMATVVENWERIR